MINTIQFDGTESGMWEIVDKLDIYQDAVSFQYDTGMMICHTLEGTMVADKGDWIIKNSRGECYPCKSETFDIIYKHVVEYSKEVEDMATMWKLLERVIETGAWLEDVNISSLKTAIDNIRYSVNGCDE